MDNSKAEAFLIKAFRQLDSEVVKQLRKLDHGKSLSYYTRNVFCSESNLSISFDPNRITVKGFKVNNFEKQSFPIKDNPVLKDVWIFTYFVLNLFCV